MIALLLLLSWLPQDDIPLGEEQTVEECDIAFRPPAGWEPVPMAAPAFVKYLAPKAGPAGAEVTFRYYEPREPVTLKAYGEELIAYLAKELPGHKITADREIAAAGCAGRLLALQAKDKSDREIVQIRSILPRSLKQIYMVDAQGEARDAEKLVALVTKILGSLRIGLPPSEAESAALRKLPAVGIGSAPAGEQYCRVMLGARKLGYERMVIREEKLDGAPAWGFEFELKLEYDDGVSTSLGRGAFTPDGATQRCDTELSIDRKEGGRHVWRESVSLRGGEAVAVRDLNGTKVEARFKVPEKTYLSDAAEVVRRALAAGRPVECAMNVLEPFHDAAHIETVEVAAPGKMKFEGEEIELTALFVKAARSRNLQYFYEKNGMLYRLASGRSPLVIQRCAREEAIKP